MQRPHELVARKLRIAFARLRQQVCAILQRNDRIHTRIEYLDVIEIGRHDLDAGQLPGGNVAGEREAVQHHDVGGVRRNWTRP